MDLGPERELALLESLSMPLVMIVLTWAAWKYRLGVYSCLLGITASLWAQSLPCLLYVCYGYPWLGDRLRSLIILLVGPITTSVAMKHLRSDYEVVNGIPVNLAMVVQQ